MLPSEWCEFMFEKTGNVDYLEMYNLWKGERIMTEVEKKYIVELEGLVQSFEVPVYAKSLEEAALKSQEYEDAGFVVGRIRPET